MTQNTATLFINGAFVEVDASNGLIAGELAYLRQEIDKIVSVSIDSNCFSDAPIYGNNGEEWYQIVEFYGPYDLRREIAQYNIIRLRRLSMEWLENPFQGIELRDISFPDKEMRKTGAKVAIREHIAADGSKHHRAPFDIVFNSIINANDRKGNPITITQGGYMIGSKIRKELIGRDNTTANRFEGGTLETVKRDIITNEIIKRESKNTAQGKANGDGYNYKNRKKGFHDRSRDADLFAEILSAAICDVFAKVSKLFDTDAKGMDSFTKDGHIRCKMHGMRCGITPDAWFLHQVGAAVNRAHREEKSAGKLYHLASMSVSKAQQEANAVLAANGINGDATPEHVKLFRFQSIYSNTIEDMRRRYVMELDQWRAWKKEQLRTGFDGTPEPTANYLETRGIPHDRVKPSDIELSDIEFTPSEFHPESRELILLAKNLDESKPRKYQREAIVTAHIVGLNWKAIAATQSLSESTIGKVLSECRDILSLQAIKGTVEHVGAFVELYAECRI